jgi:RNA polymerase sigma factor (sigma-70 family)
MASAGTQRIIRYVRRLAAAPSDSAPADEQLLERYAQARDEAAFTTLVCRHAALVLGVCRRVLQDAHAAEDAFQATFLLLAQKAGALRRPALLGPWLYGVATRTALKARARAARQRHVESRVAAPPATSPADYLVWADLRSALDAGIAHLPERYRTPFVLHHINGATVAEVAQRLGCPCGTVAARLARAKERLRARLTRRGLAPSASALAAVLAERTTQAAVPESLVATTIRSAVGGATKCLSAGAGATVAKAVGQGSANIMLMTKLGLAATVVLAVGAALCGVSLGHDDRAAERLRDDPAAKKEPPPRRMPPVDDDRLAPAADVPDAAQLIAYLNDNAKRMPVLQCDKVSLDVRIGEQAMGLEGKLVIQRPHDVRVKFDLLGKPGLDVGSNEQSWWYWSDRVEPPALVSVKRNDAVRGDAGLWPFPYGPDTLAWILGLTDRDPAAVIEVLVCPDTIELVEKANTPKGQPLRRVTVFHRTAVAAPKSQIKGYRIEDATKKEMLRAEVREARVDRQSGAIVPTHLVLYWPAEKMQVAVRLYDPEVTPPFKQGRAIQLFTAPSIVEPGAKP